MSYDLIFYFPLSPSQVPTPTRTDSGITIDGPRAFDPEDESDSYRHLVAKCRHCLTICCTSGRENFADWERMKRELLESNDGVVLIDHQVGMALVEGKTISLVFAKPKEPDTSFSIYFENGPHFEEHSFASFLDLLQHHIPKALPYRYGPQEPLQFKLKEHGLGHFQAQWRNNPALAWQPSAPFKWVHTFIRNDSRDITSRHGPHSPFLRHYRCSLISILAEPELCRDLALLKSARDFLAAAAILTNAFYSEIRIGSPGTGWWWHGIRADPSSL